jgi:hypothetical protein
MEQLIVRKVQQQYVVLEKEVLTYIRRLVGRCSMDVLTNYSNHMIVSVQEISHR